MPELVQPAVWTWYHTPWGVRSGDRTFVTWHEPGQIWIGAYDEAAQTWSTFKLLDTGEVDDHNVAAVGVRGDGRLIAAYCVHEDTAMRVRVSTNPLDVAAWGEEQLVATTTGDDIITYPNLIYLSAEDRWYLFFRYRPPGTGGVRYVTSDDDGATWSAPVQFLLPIGGEDARPYVKYGTNGVNRIDVSVTRGHPREESTNSIYHMWYDATAAQWKNSAGSNLGALPLEPSDGTLVYDGTVVKGWNWDMATGGGTPVMLFARFPAEDPSDDHRYMYARWTGAAWDVNEMVSGGGRIVTHGLEFYYSGGLGLDHADTSIVYLSRQVGSAWELERWTTGDGGNTWSSGPVTVGSTPGVKHARPFVVRGDNRVVWWGGTYETPNGQFDTFLFADPPLLLPDPPPIPASVTQLGSIVTGSHTALFEARVVTGFPTGEEPDGVEIPILDGDVTLDATADIHATLSLTTDGNRTWPRHATDLLAPYGHHEIFVRRGVDTGGGGKLWVPLGYFRIENIDQDDAPHGPIRITGADRMAGIIDARFLRPRQLSAGTNLHDLFAELVGEVYPTVVVDFDDATEFSALSRDVIGEESRHELGKDLVTAAAKVWHFDGAGVLRIRTAPDPTIPLWHLKAGRAGVLVQASRTLTRAGVYNGVVARGEGADQADPVQAVVVDVGPRSPTRWGGPFGLVPRFYSSPLITTEQQAFNAAAEMLRRNLGMPYNVTFTAVANPAIRPWDPARITHQDGQRKLHIVETITIPLSADQPVTGTTQEQTRVLVGRPS